MLGLEYGGRKVVTRSPSALLGKHRATQRRRENGRLLDVASPSTTINVTTARGLPMQSRSFNWAELPVPIDDGAADHLLGMSLPDVDLPSTGPNPVNLARVAGTMVIYAYPMTGGPGVVVPPDWEDIPGAPGCTPQSCSFRDHFAELRTYGVNYLFGLSTQRSAFQLEASERLHLPFPLLSDEKGEITNSLRMPTFVANGTRLLRRLTFIANEGEIIKVFYPVYPPDRNPTEVIQWLGRFRDARAQTQSAG